MAAIEVEEKGAVDWVTLNRPDSLNAMNPEMIEALGSYFRGLADRQDRRIVVLRGKGKAFCAGLDLKNEAERDASAAPPDIAAGLRVQRRIANIYLAMRRCPQPIISLI